MFPKSSRASSIFPKGEPPASGPSGVLRTVAFGLFSWGGLAAIAVFVVAGIAAIFVRKAGARSAAAGARISSATKASLLGAFALGAIAGWSPLQMLVQSKFAPPIHDITTDTSNPPAFVAIVPLRAKAGNPMAYEGEAVAAQQRDAYPLIETFHSKDPPERVFPRAIAGVREMGWQIVAEVPAEGRIEATDTTPFFGFVDDIVIRVGPDGKGSRVDVRSLSRIGESDVGANARRVLRYLDRLQSLQSGGDGDREK